MMPWLKEFTLSGNCIKTTINNDHCYLFFGLLGSILTFWGLFLKQEPAQIVYFTGSALLLLTAIHFKLLYFIALEIILMSGHGASFFAIGSKLQFAMPILLSLQLLLFYYLSNQLTNLFISIGILGIALLSIGFAYQNQWIFFAGGTAIAIYAFYAAKTTKAALLWAILNSLFACFAVIKLIF